MISGISRVAQKMGTFSGALFEKKSFPISGSQLRSQQTTYLAGEPHKIPGNYFTVYPNRVSDNARHCRYLNERRTSEI